MFIVIKNEIHYTASVRLIKCIIDNEKIQHNNDIASYFGMNEDTLIAILKERAIVINSLTLHENFVEKHSDIDIDVATALCERIINQLTMRDKTTNTNLICLNVIITNVNKLAGEKSCINDYCDNLPNIGKLLSELSIKPVFPIDDLTVLISDGQNTESLLALMATNHGALLNLNGVEITGEGAHESVYYLRGSGELYFSTKSRASSTLTPGTAFVVNDTFSVEIVAVNEVDVHLPIDWIWDYHTGPQNPNIPYSILRKAGELHKVDKFLQSSVKNNIIAGQKDIVIQVRGELAFPASELDISQNINYQNDCYSINVPSSFTLIQLFSDHNVALRAHEMTIQNYKSTLSTIMESNPTAKCRVTRVDSEMTLQLCPCAFIDIKDCHVNEINTAFLGVDTVDTNQAAVKAFLERHNTNDLNWAGGLNIEPFLRLLDALNVHDLRYAQLLIESQDVQYISDFVGTDLQGNIKIRFELVSVTEDVNCLNFASNISRYITGTIKEILLEESFGVNDQKLVLQHHDADTKDHLTSGDYFSLPIPSRYDSDINYRVLLIEFDEHSQVEPNSESIKDCLLDVFGNNQLNFWNVTEIQPFCVHHFNDDIETVLINNKLKLLEHELFTDENTMHFSKALVDYNKGKYKVKSDFFLGVVFISNEPEKIIDEMFSKYHKVDGVHIINGDDGQLKKLSGKLGFTINELIVF